MKTEIVVFVSNGYADWELGFVCAELHKTENFKIKTIALTMEPISSMGGLKIIPDYSLESFLEQNTQTCEIGMLLLCGGSIWSEFGYKLPEIKRLVDICTKNKVLISAICDATTFLAYNGYLDNLEHTGNSLEYIIKNCPHYIENNHYLEKQCVFSDNFITANGTASLEFAKEIMKHFKVKSEEEIEQWYEFNKKGFYAI